MDTSPIELKCSDDVIDVSLSPVSYTLAAIIVDGSIEIHKFDDKKDILVKTTKIEGLELRTTVFSKDEMSLFCGCEDGTILLLSIDGSEIWRSSADKKHEHVITRVYCLNDKYYFSGDDEGVVKLWEPNSKYGYCKTFTHHQDYISDFDYNEKEDCVLISSADGSLSVISMKDRTLLYQTDNCNDEVLSCCIIKNGKFICGGTQEGVINIYQWGEENEICDRITGHPESIDGILKIDDDTICTGSDDGVLRVVQVMPNQLIGVLGFHDDFPVERIGWSFDRVYIGTCSHDNIVRLFDVSILKDDENDSMEENENEKVIGESDNEEESELSDSGKKEVNKKRQRDEESSDEGRKKKVSAKNCKLKKNESTEKKSDFFDEL